MRTLAYLLILLQVVIPVLANPIPSNTVTFGDGTNSDKVLKANKGAGAANPKIKYNASSSKWQFSHDGTTYKDFGSGGGGGGSGLNLLEADDNAGFEEGTTGWTASGGTFATTSSSPFFGTLSATWTATGSGQTLSSATKSVKEGLKGYQCLAGISYTYSGTSGDYVLEVTDGTNTLSTSLSLTNTTTPSDAMVGFTCPSSGSVTMRLRSIVASPGQIKIDGIKQAAGLAHLGSNLLLATISSAEFYGSVFFPGATSCSWGVTASDTWTSFSADADCTLPAGGNIKGKAAAPATKIPAIQLDNAPAGEYMLIARGQFEKGATIQPCGFRFTDGTNTSEVQSMGQNTTNTHWDPVMTGKLSYTTSGSRTIQLQATGLNGSSTCNINNSTAVLGFTIEVWRFPNAATQALLSQDLTGWYISAKQYGANFSVATGGAYAGIENSGITLAAETGSAAVKQACAGTTAAVGTTCDSAGANESVGITFDVPRAGAYEVCAQYHMYVGTAAGSVPYHEFKIVETPNNAQTISQSAFPTKAFRAPSTAQSVNFAENQTLCTIMNFASTGTKTLRLFDYPQGLAANFDMGTASDPQVHWHVKPLTASMPLPAYFSPPVGHVELWTSNGYGAVATKVKRYLNSSVVGSDMSIADGANDGTSISILTPGKYCVRANAAANSGEAQVGIMKNPSASSKTANPYSVTVANGRLAFDLDAPRTAAVSHAQAQWCGPFVAGDMLYIQGNGNGAFDASYEQVSVTKVTSQ